MSKKTVRSDFFIPKPKLAFTKLMQAFLKAPIFYQHVDPEYHNQIQTSASGYTIGRVFSQLTLDDLAQWYPVASFLKRWFWLRPGMRLTTVSL